MGGETNKKNKKTLSSNETTVSANSISVLTLFYISSRGGASSHSFEHFLPRLKRHFSQMSDVNLKP